MKFKLNTKTTLLIAGGLLILLGLYLSGTFHAILSWIGGDPSADQTAVVIGVLASSIGPWIIKLALGVSD